MPRGEPFEAVIAGPRDTLETIGIRELNSKSGWMKLARLNNLAPTYMTHPLRDGDLIVVGDRPVPRRGDPFWDQEEKTPWD